jgi:hypothetical protein
MWWVLFAVGAIAVMLASPGSASAAFGLVPDSFRVSSTDPNGDLVTQAGAHADATTSFRLNTVRDARGVELPDEDLKDVVLELPVGAVGDPTATPQCSAADFGYSPPRCPTATQVGVARLLIKTLPIEPAPSGAVVPVFNLVPPRGQVAQFGFAIARNKTVITASLRSATDYGITATVRNTPGGLFIFGADVTLWGVPADPAHDALRFRTGETAPGDASRNPLPSQAPRNPFFTNPFECGPVPTTRIAVSSWQHPETMDRAVATSPVGTGCEKLSFRPSISVTPTTDQPDTPTGLSVNLKFPQNDDPNGLATPPLRDAIVTLPEGMTINPASAGGLMACADADLRLASSAPVSCPDASKIGTVEATTPVLATPLTGGIYLRPQASDDPASGDMFRIALVLENRERGVSVRLPGRIRANPATGRLETTFRDNPQLPVSDISLTFKSGPRAPLVTPATCGTHTVHAHLTSWGGQTADLDSSFSIACTPGLGMFAPAFTAGVTNPVGGAFSPFVLQISKPDGQSPLDGLSMTLPTGLLANISDHLHSQVGSATALAGPGTNPYALPGRVYLEGAYGDAPFSLRVVVPAVAGPFDLGTVVVRQRVYVDRDDAHVTIVSDPLPTIVKGVPVRMQRIDVAVDKPGFMVNPTSCAAKTVSAVLHAETGQTAPVSSHFQVGSCSALPFRPRMSLRVGARGRTKRDITTPFSATLRMTPGQANNRSVKVTLPKPLNSRLAIVNQACTLEAYRADDCGARARIGSAVAVTPLLRDPLRGSAYFVRNPARRLPDIMVALKGQVDFDLTGKISIPRDLTLTTNFDLVPDVPITMFRLDLVAGRNGPIGVVQNLCSRRTRRALVARLALRAQSGRLVERNQRISVAGCGRGAARSRRAGAKRSASKSGARARR